MELIYGGRVVDAQSVTLDGDILKMCITDDASMQVMFEELPKSAEGIGRSVVIKEVVRGYGMLSAYNYTVEGLRLEFVIDPFSIMYRVKDKHWEYARLPPKEIKDPPRLV
jgi:hypothetical protein